MKKRLSFIINVGISLLLLTLISVKSDTAYAASNNNDCTLYQNQLIFEDANQDAFRYNLNTSTVIDSQWFTSAGGHGVAGDVSQNKLFTQRGANVIVKDLVTGADLATLSAGTNPIGITGPYNGYVYVNHFAGVSRINTTTNAVDLGFISLPSSQESMGITVGPDNNLYVADHAGAQSVKRYNITTGAFIDTFILNSSIPSIGPLGIQQIKFGTDGNFYLANSGSNIYRFNGTTGAYIDTFYTNSSGFTWSLEFDPDTGDMYAVSIFGGGIDRVNTAGAVTALTGLPGAKSVHILPVQQCSYSLGNRVWIDYTTPGAPTNNDGILNGSESPRQSVSVTLLDSSNATVDDPNTVGVQPYTLTTNAQGFYRFDGLALGTYRVRVNAGNFTSGGSLEGYLSSSSTTANNLTADNNSDHGINTLTPEAAGVISGNAVLTSSNTLSDKDAGATGAGDNGALGDATDVLTVDFGFIPSSRIGDYLWLDTNRNGIQDSGEQPVSGATATLLDAAGTAVPGYAAQTTSALGAYSFNVYPGTYRVRFTNLPANYLLTSQSTNASTADTSKADGDGITIGVTVELGASYLNLDAGIVLASNTPTTLSSTGISSLVSTIVSTTIIAATLLIGYLARREGAIYRARY